MDIIHNGTFPADAVAIILRTSHTRSDVSQGEFIVLRESCLPFEGLKGCRGDTVIWLKPNLDETFKQQVLIPMVAISSPAWKAMIERSKQKVDLGKLADAIAYIEAVNRLPLNEITWTRNNIRVSVTTEQIDEWRFTGLNNKDFAREHLLPNIL